MAPLRECMAVMSNELKLRRLQVELLEDLYQVGSTEQVALAQHLLSLCERAAGSPEGVVYWCREQELEPLAAVGSHAQMVLESKLTGLKEPLVEQAHARRSAAAGSSELLQQPCALALPMQESGVVLLARSRPYSVEERSLLSSLLGAATVLLEQARRQSLQSQTVVGMQAELQRSQAHAEVLREQLQAARSFSESLSEQQLKQEFVECLQHAVEHQAGVLCDGSEVVASWGLAMSPPGVRELVQRAGGRLLYIDDFSGSSFRPLLGTLRSAVCLPLDELELTLLLASERLDAFDELSRELLQSLAQLLALSVSRARLHQEVAQGRALLIQASKMAALGQLAAGVAHQLNTPLGVIRLNLEGVQMRSDRPQLVVKKVDRAMVAVTRMQEIIKRLLLYSRSDRSTQGCDLDQMVRSTLDLLEPLLSKERLILGCELGCGARCAGNPDELSQVVSNLLINAKQACPQGGEIQLRTWSERELAFLEVRDNGDGVAPELRERIFEPFFTTRPVDQGTGLGLAICRETLRRLGGELSYRDAPGGGACFRLSLPHQR